jgi:hypothetical protein
MKIKKWTTSYLVNKWYRYTSVDGNGYLEGRVFIAHSYDEKIGKLFLGKRYPPTYCQQIYLIRIHLGKNNVSVEIIDHWNKLIAWADNHIYPDTWTCCLCASQDLLRMICDSAWLDLEEFYNKLIIPFFYSQTYHTIHWKWIMWEYSHGDKGIIERYGKEINPDRNFLFLTLSCLTPLWKQILTNPSIAHSGNLTSEYKKWIFLLREHLQKILPFNFKTYAILSQGPSYKFLR